MIKLYGKKYELFFSNQLAPLTALNYADELFFQEFQRLARVRYRIFSLIQNGWQKKFIPEDDIRKLKKQFNKNRRGQKWIDDVLKEYKFKSRKLRKLLLSLSRQRFVRADHVILIHHVWAVRQLSASLDAMSNMLYLFSALIGDVFFHNLSSYSTDAHRVRENFIFYTQPIQPTRLAKIIIQRVSKKISLSRSDLVFSRILRVGAYIKDDVSDLLEQRGKMMRKLFLEISYRSHLALADLEYLQIHELDMALRHGIESSFIKARQVITVLFYQQRKLKVLEGKNASRFLRQGSFQELKDDQHVQIIKGNSASFGKVKGRVVVALESFIAIQKMKKGNILVSPYTAVEYLPAMRLAAAIITDTGGITSHAAIVSREFKIPCIIGTKIATKVLKDGDLVEVDADKGIVRIL